MGDTVNAKKIYIIEDKEYVDLDYYYIKGDC